MIPYWVMWMESRTFFIHKKLGPTLTQLDTAVAIFETISKVADILALSLLTIVSARFWFATPKTKPF